jgi:ADP-dependent phosphofructokinase/glucokinase
MSKRELKKFLNQLPKSELEAQIVALYDKFIPVKTYFDFVFNPKEDQLVNDAKVKISLEFYPLKRKRPKMRRSVAQKFIKHFISLGVDDFMIADLMLYAIEIAQTYTSKKTVNSELFFKSMLSSYEQAIRFMIEKGILNEFQNRVEAIKEETIRQDWFNQYEFIAITERFEY